MLQKNFCNIVKHVHWYLQIVCVSQQLNSIELDFRNIMKDRLFALRFEAITFIKKTFYLLWMYC